MPKSWKKFFKFFKTSKKPSNEADVAPSQEPAPELPKINGVSLLQPSDKGPVHVPGGELDEDAQNTIWGVGPVNNHSGIDSEQAHSRVFAVIVAIDKYRNSQIPELSGCENDARSFLDFLTDILHVPSSNVVFLSNESATRGAIITSIQNHLIENVEIRKGDAMIFFYAGHGARVEAPPGWLADQNRVETLCPYDEGTQDDEGSTIYGIPDRTFDGLMRRLAHEKGDNITAIFDSCHSGGMSRVRGKARCVPPNISPSPLPKGLDDHIWNWGLSTRTATAVVPTGFLYRAMTSHVLLAACRQEEVALESTVTTEPRGAFTTALVETLRICHLAHVTYARLMELLPKLTYQHPQCEGTNKDRILFNNFAIQGRSMTYRITMENNVCFVEAGSIHGVVDGTEFSVVLPHDTSQGNAQVPRIIHLVAVQVDALRCMVAPSVEDMLDHLLLGSRAVVSKWNARQLKVHFHLPTGELFAAVGPEEYSDVSVVFDDRNRIILERSDPLLSRHASREMEIPRNEVSTFLDAVAHFNYHLYRVNPSAPVNQQLTVELHRLRRTQEITAYRPTFVPTGEDLLAVDPEPIPMYANSPYVLKEVKEAVVTDMTPYYGLTLANHSNFNLFPYVFYFDPSNYSIQAWYLPPSSSMSAPLPSQRDGEPSKLPIGYGASGTDTIQFSLPEGSKSDSGFLKIFVSTSYVDMEAITQLAATDELARRARTTPQLLTHTWDAWIYVLTCFSSSSSSDQTEARLR